MCLQFCHIFCLSIDTESCCHLSQTILYNATATRAFDDDKGEDKDYANDSNEYIIVQEDMENLIQKECKIRFSLAHSPPIMSTLLDDRLRYLGDEELARSIITGTFGILADLDPVTTLILKKIEKNGLNNNERGRQRYYYHPRGIHPLLEKGRRVHILVRLRRTLWPL